VLDTTDGLITIRACAQRFIAAQAEHGDDFAAFVEAATPACRELMERPDLLTLGFQLGTHRTSIRLLYGDGDLSIIVAHEPPRLPIPVHDHGMWEMLGLYQGRLEHRLYERLDDDSRPGFSQVREIDRRTMTPGDVLCVPPAPNDVHGFTAETDDSYLVAILPGWYNRIRRYFDVDNDRYFLREWTPV
jgi:predicted metal-dependent enzyme (double-stranded beta helix superfamily)